jgi:hypothetical protein
LFFQSGFYFWPKLPYVILLELGGHGGGNYVVGIGGENVDRRLKEKSESVCRGPTLGGI